MEGRRRKRKLSAHKAEKQSGRESKTITEREHLSPSEMDFDGVTCSTVSNLSGDEGDKQDIKDEQVKSLQNVLLSSLFLSL